MQFDDDEQPVVADEEAVAADDDGGDDGDDGLQAVEADARKQGWVPRGEFRGDPSDWTPAEEYVRMGDPKYLRKALKDTRKAVSRLQESLQQKDQEFGERLDRFERMNKAQRAKLYTDIEAARRQAVEDGDTKRYDQLNQTEAALYEQEEAASKPSPKTAKVDEPPQEVKDWVDANPWFVKDKALNKAAQGIHEQLMDEEPHLTVAENLVRTRTEIIKRFPEKFGKGARPGGNGHSPVEGGQRIPAAKGGKSWAEIPSDDKKVIKRHIEEGLYKDQAEAAKAYWS